jgi:hypothetical protein
MLCKDYKRKEFEIPLSLKAELIEVRRSQRKKKREREREREREAGVEEKGDDV